MFCRRMLVTNNPFLNEKIPSCDFVKGSSLDVLVRVRDHIHSRWVLLTHPLYGNLRPYQHPYRSVLMETLPKGRSSADPLSVEYIENALRIYTAERSRILMVSEMPEEVQEDFAFIDAELMKESLSRYGMFVREVSKN